MASQAVSLTPFFNNPGVAAAPAPPPPPAPTPGLFSRMGRGIQSMAYAPARHATEEAAQGLANRLTDLFTSHQPEITTRIRDVFSNALLRRIPDNYAQLRHHIQSFLRNPSKTDLDQIKRLLPTIDAASLRVLAPAITQAGVDALVQLLPVINREIAEHPNIVPTQPPTLTVSAAAPIALRTAEAILTNVIENYEGALVQTLTMLTQSMTAEDGPIRALREQFNNPQHGIVAATMTQLRAQCNSRAHPFLRECKEAIEAYRSALRRQAAGPELVELMRHLHTKLEQLNVQRTHVPQITAPQWPELERLDREIQAAIAAPDSMPAPAQLLAQSDGQSQMLLAAFTAQRGMVEEAADIIVEGIARGVEHLVPLPRRMWQNIVAPQAPSQPASPPSSPATTPLTSAPLPPPPIAPASPGVTATFNIGNLADQAQGFLNSVLASSGSVLSQMAAKSLATLFLYAFEKVRDHIQLSSAQTHLLGTINPMIRRLQGAITHSSWNELTEVLRSALTFMQQQQVYLQGLRLPLNPVRSHESAIPSFLNNINAHQNALQPPAHQIPQTVTAAMIHTQSNLLKARTSSYGPARLIAEKICGLDGSQTLYKEIFSAEDDAQDLPDLFRERLFEKIDGSAANFFTKWCAKRLYDILIPLSRFYVYSTLDKLLNKVSEWIHRPSTISESKDEMMIKRVRNWMAVTSGAYNEVANAPASQTKDFNAMMEDALKMKERNGGLTQQELYSAVAKTAIEAFGPRIQWKETIDQYFSSEIPADSPLYFLNPVVKGLNFICSFCLDALIFVPQWIGNHILQTGAKLALSHSPFIKDYAEQSIESLRRNTPSSYAVQRMIFRQQQKVLRLLQQSLRDEAAGNASLLTRSTNIKKLEIRGLVEYVMEILNKSEYRTQDRLRNYLNSQAPVRDRALHELDDTFLPEVMEMVVTTISVAVSAITEEEEMQQVLHDGLQIANDAFDAQAPVSDEEFAAVERGIREMTDQILETALFHAIAEKFDFTNEKQKRGITQFITTLKTQSGRFAAEITHPAGQIASGAPLTAPNLLEKITAMVQSSSRYNTERLDAQGASDGNRNFHTETKYHMNELSRQLLGHCTPLSERLNAMKSEADAMVKLDHQLPSLLISNQILRTMQEKLRQPRFFEEIPLFKTQISQLQVQLAALRRQQAPIPIGDDIERYCRDLTLAVSELENLQKAGQLLEQAIFTFVRLHQEKLAAIGSPPTARLKDLERELCDCLQQLPYPRVAEQLKAHVLALMLSQNGQAAEDARARFFAAQFQITATNQTETDRQCAVLRTTQEGCLNRITRATQDLSHLYAGHQRSVQNHARESATEANAVNQWAQNQHDLPIWNLFVFDMQWVTETVKGLAFDRCKTKVDQLFQALYERHNYVGFTNQVVLLPFLENFGKHRLRNIE